MIKRREFVAGSLGLAAAGLTAAIPLWGCSRTAAEEDTVSADSLSTAAYDTDDTSLAYAEHINKDQIMTIDIVADEDAWQTMLDNATSKEYIEVDITINDVEIKQVGIKPKGNSSLSSIASDPTTDRYSFKVKFDEYVNDQTWLGLDKLVLNSNWADATSMKEYFSYDVLESIGVATPLFSYAEISLNGEPWGFYLAIEVMDKAYRRRLFDGNGEMYKPDTMDLVAGGGMGGAIPEGEAGQMPEGEAGQVPSMPEGGMPSGQMPEGGAPSGEMPQGLTAPEGGEFGGEGNFDAGMGGGMGSDNGVALIYTDDEVSSYSSIFDNAETNSDEEDHKRVIEAIKNLNAGTDLETYVDVEACLRYFAAHTSVVSLDSYEGSMGHNYYLYEHEGQITMLPWDYNMSFGGFQSGDASTVVNFPIDTPVSGTTMDQRPLISKLFEVPEYLEQYREYMQSVVDECYADGVFEKKIESLHERIATYLENDPSAFYAYDEYLAAKDEFKKLVALRGESLQGQLDGEVPSTTATQTDSDQLIDASAVDLTVLGGQDDMGMGRMDEGGGRGEMGESTGEGAIEQNSTGETTPTEQQGTVV